VKPVREFTLEEHDGPYERWPLRTRVLRGGRPTGAEVPGHSLLHQFELAGPRYLLVVDWDCPFEEETSVVLLDPALRVLSVKRFGAPWGSFLLRDATVVDERTLDLDFGPQDVQRVTVRERRPWWIGPLLRAERLRPGD